MISFSFSHEPLPRLPGCYSWIHQNWRRLERSSKRVGAFLLTRHCHEMAPRFLGEQLFKFGSFSCGHMYGLLQILFWAPLLPCDVNASIGSLWSLPDLCFLGTFSSLARLGSLDWKASSRARSLLEWPQFMFPLRVPHLVPSNHVSLIWRSSATIQLPLASVATWCSRFLRQNLKAVPGTHVKFSEWCPWSFSHWV